jgi:hypothetical protein
MRTWTRQVRNIIEGELRALPLVVILCAANHSRASDTESRDDLRDALPDKDLLEFMLEFDQVDAESFELLIERGKKDTTNREPRDETPEPNSIHSELSDDE